MREFGSAPITVEKRLGRNSPAGLKIRAPRPPESGLRRHSGGIIEEGGWRTLKSEESPDQRQAIPTERGRKRQMLGGTLQRCWASPQIGPPRSDTRPAAARQPQSEYPHQEAPRTGKMGWCPRQIERQPQIVGIQGVVARNLTRRKPFQLRWLHPVFHLPGAPPKAANQCPFVPPRAARHCGPSAAGERPSRSLPISPIITDVP
jgi:hypothetical protein